MTLVPAPSLEHAFDASIAVETPVEVGETGLGQRRVIAIAGGEISGPRLSGRILPGGADYQIIRPGGLTELHARYVVETPSGLVYVENTGIRFGPAEALERIRQGLPVDPALIYFRSAPRFETAARDLGWLTTSLFVASGARHPDRVVLSVFRLV
jgi:hypothetical protein